MGRIKVGQIGICHEHAAGKMQTLRGLSDVYEIVGVVDDSATSSPHTHVCDDRRPYEGLPWLSMEELLQTPGLQLVVIETANDDLIPAALQCMERHLPMHLDKSGGRDFAMYRQLIEGCRQRDLPLQLGYMFRHNPAMQWCIQAVRQDWLGEVFEIQANMSHDYGGPTYPRYLSHFPGGIVFILVCHLIDLTVSLLGRPTQVTSFLKAAPGEEVDACTLGQVVMEYPHALATLRACRREVRGLSRRSLKVCGTNGTFELSPLERFDGQPLQAKVTLRQAAGDLAAGEHLLDFGVATDRYRSSLLELAQIIRGQTPNPRIYDHELLVHEVVLAASGMLKWQS